MVARPRARTTFRPIPMVRAADPDAVETLEINLFTLQLPTQWPILQALMLLSEQTRGSRAWIHTVYVSNLGVAPQNQC